MAVSYPTKILASVDLPAPESPKTAQTLPGYNLNEIESKIFFPPSWYSKETSLTTNLPLGGGNFIPLTGGIFDSSINAFISLIAVELKLPDSNP